MTDTAPPTESTPVPDHLRHHVHAAEALVRELHRTQQRNARLRSEIAAMRRQLDDRKPPADVGELQREIERLKSALERAKFHARAERDQWKAYAESLEALLAGQPQRPVPRPGSSHIVTERSEP